MWDGLLLLLLLGLVMGGASFAAGSLPLSFSLSARQLRLMTALGTGVLVGTSLIVIIPEGVETLYSSSGGSNSHGERGLDVRSASVYVPAGVSTSMGKDVWTRDAIPVAYDLDEDEDDHTPFRSGPDDGFKTGPDTGDANTGMGEPGIPNDKLTDENGHEAGATEREPHAWIGVSLILGFILMYLIDTLPQQASSSSQPPRFQISLNQFSFNRRSLSTEQPPTPSTGTFSNAGAESLSHSSRPSSTTIGLVIHAAADGIALGASSTSESSRLSFIIFIALMIHKAPAAFGLTSVLLKQGLSKRMARTHLIIFSLAAPVGAVVTFLAIHLLGFSSSMGESANTEFATGVLLLFSGGTFLYVAMHTMQEKGSGSHSHGETNVMNGYAGVPIDEYSGPPPAQAKHAGTQLVDTLVTVGGMLLPLLTQWGHAH